MDSTTSRADQARVTLREVEPSDVEACARIVFDAFAGIHDHHRFPRDFAGIEATTALMGMWIPHPAVWGVVAEVDGRVVGSNFLDERDPIRGVGPITVDPSGHQNAGVGRLLMRAVLERGADARGIRLVQDGFHMRSLSLYTRLGFEVTASCVLVEGGLRGQPVDGVDVRPLGEDDLSECGELCTRVHGFARTGALRDALHGGLVPFGAFRDGRLVAYATTLTLWTVAHGVAEGDEEMKALLLGAAPSLEHPPKMLVPLRSELFRWCLERGLRAVKPMNVMAVGEHREPTGSWFPSVLY
ncbi:MAG TPA: GNAT family N-acetyltransferase [Thermoleophilaceae bacterium]